jgi:hypothetical protein
VKALALASAPGSPGALRPVRLKPTPSKEDTFMKTEQAKTKPVAEVRFGNISAAIWRNEGDSGTWYNVTVERTYRDGTEYKRSPSFGRDDLLTLAKVADQAHSEIFNLQRFDGSES